MPFNLTRSILTIFIPGGVSVVSWLFLIDRAYPNVIDTLESNATVYTGILFGSIVIAGSLFEIVSGAWEARWDDESENELQVDENWYIYLSRSVSPEPVGYRYLSRIVTRMYFESNMALASFSFFLGSAFVFFRSQGVISIFGWVCLVLLLVVPFAFKKSATRSHNLLCITRKEINERLSMTSA